MRRSGRSVSVVSDDLSGDRRPKRSSSSFFSSRSDVPNRRPRPRKRQRVVEDGPLDFEQVPSSPSSEIESAELGPLASPDLGPLSAPDEEGAASPILSPLSSPLENYGNPLVLEPLGLPLSAGWTIDGVTLTKESVSRLQGKRQLDDLIIDFFIKFIGNYVLTRQQKERIFVFNTFFYKMLQRGGTSKEERYRYVKSWTNPLRKRKKKLWEFDFVIVPINDSNVHWWLAVICFPANAIVEDANRPACLPILSAPSASDLIAPSNVVHLSDQSSDGEVTSTTQSPMSQSGRSPVADDSPMSRRVGRRFCRFCAVKGNSLGAGDVNALTERAMMSRNQTPTIIVLDSMRGSNPRRGLGRVRELLASYLQMEFLTKNTSPNLTLIPPGSWRVYIPCDTPQQDNPVDCGLFLLEFVRYLCGRVFKLASECDSSVDDENCWACGGVGDSRPLSSDNWHFELKSSRVQIAQFTGSNCEGRPKGGSFFVRLYRRIKGLTTADPTRWFDQQMVSFRRRVMTGMLSEMRNDAGWKSNPKSVAALTNSFSVEFQENEESKGNG